ncbi:hypothetical protein NQ318_013071 [Aromia moschata]|uniref:Sanpodo n=1 Tax=Aromia moschata TaxID=1265417 RepID=A0AAV8Y0F5_9CUCU|nr:hypothetical protein NQ318_013071 [Aromia moschata]
MATAPNYYNNPAFCQQSEFHNNGQPRALSPQGCVRYSPVGAQTVHRVLDTSSREGRTNPALDEDDVQEQEFYEEVVVDDEGFITEKSERVESKLNRNQSRRYEYIPMQQSPRKKDFSDETDAVPRVHRYSTMPEKETELSTNNGRYALVPVEVLGSMLSSRITPNSHRYEYIQDPPRQNGNRYEYIRASPPKSKCEYVQQVHPQQQQQQSQRVCNPAATQKLHELLSTPRKSPQKALTSPSSRRVASSAPSPVPKEAFRAQDKSPPKHRQTSRAHQKLNYALGTKQLARQEDKRHTAIVAPMCSSPNHSVYSETTYSGKSESWMNVNENQSATRATVAVAAVLMLLCGAVSSALCFYMISLLGRLYYLDFGIVSGFTCLILGLLGFRARAFHWLPNRNYISGYLVMSVFSLMTCVGLLVLLVLQPRPGSPLADITSGAVCGVSALSLIISAAGVVSSYCCRYPPPDNRVQHCAEGFTV